MDTTEKYIKMNKKAMKIQKTLYDLNDGDFIYYEADGFVPVVDIFDGHSTYDHLEMRKDEITRFVWLPRQDQLQYMLFESENWKDKHFDDKMSGLIDFFNCEGCNEDFETMEQVWLGFIMLELYGKIWNGEDWID